MEELDKPKQLAESYGTLRPVKGQITGVIALLLGTLCFLGVLAFHFPEYLTTPQLRKSYSVDALRRVMFWGTVVAGALSLFNVIGGRARGLALAAFALIGLTLALGGHKVPVNDFADDTPYIGLDGVHPRPAGQYWTHRAHHEVPSLWRLHAVHHSVKSMDWLVGSRQHILGLFITRTLVLSPNKNYAAHFAFLDYLVGPTVQSGRARPDRYVVVGDCVPNGSFSQLALPLRWKG